MSLDTQFDLNTTGLKGKVIDIGELDELAKSIDRTTEDRDLEALNECLVGVERLKPWLNQLGCMAPQESADVVCAIEDILEVSRRRHDPWRRWVYWVYMDEASQQPVRETRDPLPR